MSHKSVRPDYVPPPFAISTRNADGTQLKYCGDCRTLTYQTYLKGRYFCPCGAIIPIEYAYLQGAKYEKHGSLSSGKKPDGGIR